MMRRMMRRRIRIIMALCLAVTSIASAITPPGGIAQAELPVPQLQGAETEPLVPLSTSWVPQPGNLADFVQDQRAAIQLGKALFWDTQVGSDGVQSCASCHFSAGADTRAKGQVSPGVLAGDTTFQVGGPNYTLQPSDFPFHKLADPDNADSAVLRDANDVASSQGVIRRDFLDAPAAPQADAVDRCTHVADPDGFAINGVNTRRVEPRNAPTVINAVFNFRNFWDGRANNIFNGVNPFGPRDPNAFIYKVVNGQPVTVTVSIPNASLASQAVGPPGSPFEMSCAGRPFAQIGRKLLGPGVVPLGTQAVAPDDSVLGPLANSRTSPRAYGLTTSYAELIKQAFKPEYTSDTLRVGDGQFTEMEANFSLFFGLAVQLYEATLVSDQTPFDRYAMGDTTALTAQQVEGLQVFNIQGRCASCHSVPTFTGATVANAGDERLERMRMGDGALAVYDNGFYNTGVRPITEDPGNGGVDPFGNPLSDARYLQQLNAPYPINSSIVTTVPGPLQAGERTAVDGAFKTPGLRNVELTGPYMHNGGLATLRQVVDFYNRGGDFAHQNMASLDPRIAPLGLSDDQKNALVAFMLALTDERVRYNRAPFDHPALCVPNGAEGDQTTVVESTPGSGEAKDAAPLCLPAVGATGSATPNQPFLGLDPRPRPEISITGKPADLTNDPNPTFTFTVDAGATSVQCALDGSPYTACTSPQSYIGLTDGAHSFKVRAADAAGNVNVVRSTFSVDTTPPAVSIIGQPANPTNNAQPAFTVSAEEGATLTCSLTPSGGTDAFAPCRVPQSYRGLADGAYTFKVQAKDAAGNVNVAPYAFTIDTVAPAVPTDVTATAADGSEIDLSWTAATDTVGVAGYQVFRDGGTTPLGTVTSGTTFADTGLAPSSPHSYTVVAVDAAGNASAPSVAAVATTLTPPATATPTAPPATATPTAPPAATATPVAATATLPAAPVTATTPPTATARPRPTATKTARSDPRREQPTVTVRVPRGIISHGTLVMVSVRTRPGADTRITLRLTRQGTQCTGSARRRVCARVTAVLAQKVVHGRANRQGLLTRSVALGYSPASPLRATLEVHVSTPYGAVTHTAIVLLQPAPRARHLDPASRPAKRSSTGAHTRSSTTRQQAGHVRGHQRQQVHHSRGGHPAAAHSTLAADLPQRIGAVLHHLDEALHQLLQLVGVRLFL